MRFSIIVPIYNVSVFLPQCIESIVGQTYTNWELILVDDGSSDSSGKICDEYANKDKRIKVIHKENGGLVSARQAGTKIAQGEYIVAVDGDDWVDTSLLEYINAAIQSHHPDIICYGFYRAISTQNKRKQALGFRSGYYTKQEIKTEILPHLIRDQEGRYFTPNIWGKAFKRELYMYYQSLVNPDITLGEDLVVTAPCIAQAQSLYILENPLYYYRINPESMLRCRSHGYSWENFHLVNESLHHTLQGEISCISQLRRQLCHALFNVAKSHLQTNRPYKDVSKEILYQFSLPQNRQAIQQAKFSFGCKDWFAQFALRYKQIWLIKLYATLERRYIKK